MNKLTADQLAALACIAHGHLNFETLDLSPTRTGDDFKEVAVWSVKAALEAAFLLGAQSAAPQASKAVKGRKGASKAGK